MCDQKIESCGCVDEEHTGARTQEHTGARTQTAGADTAGVDCCR